MLHVLTSWMQAQSLTTSFKNIISMHLVNMMGAQCRASPESLHQISRRYFPRMQNKKRRTRRIPLPPYSPRIDRFMKLKVRDVAKRQQPVQPVRLEPDRPRTDNDPDPFAYKLNPENLYPIYRFEGWPLSPGIRPDQLRYGECSLSLSLSVHSFHSLSIHRIHRRRHCGVRCSSGIRGFPTDSTCTESPQQQRTRDSETARPQWSGEMVVSWKWLRKSRDSNRGHDAQIESIESAPWKVLVQRQVCRSAVHSDLP